MSNMLEYFSPFFFANSVAFSEYLSFELEGALCTEEKKNMAPNRKEQYLFGRKSTGKE